ncbi:MAG: PAS domain-containing protein, partial [Desulfurispora sp.]|uniref:PAS domain-containing protein n=1 Tax=Desulfurispora sp. TaxID=3014275 RepID=UPI0040490116
MRYRYKLAIQLAVFILPLILLGSLLLWLNWQQQRYGQLFGQQLDKIAAAWQLEEGINRQVLALHRYITTADPQYLRQMQEQQEQIQQLLENLQRIVRPARLPLLAELAAELRAYQQQAALITGRLDAGDGLAARQILRSSAFQEREKVLLQKSTRLRELRWQDTRTLSRDLTAFGRNIWYRSAILIGSTILLSLLLTYYFHRQLVADNNRFKQILQTTRNVVITVNDREIITGFNRIAEEIFQLPAARALGRKFSQVFTGRQAPGEIAFTYPLARVMRSGQGRCNEERPYNAADGWPYTLRVDCLPLDRYRGRTLGAVLIMRDVTEQKIVEEKLQGLAVRDSLTLLYNHRYLRRRLQQELARARQLRSRVAFLLMDVKPLPPSLSLRGGSFLV